MKKQLAMDFCAGWLVLVHGAGDPSPEEWQAYVALLDRHVMELRGQLVVSLGGGPSSGQRAQTIPIGRRRFDAARAAGEPAPRTAVMSGSMVVRGLVTVFNWFFDHTFRAFGLDDDDAAFDHLGVTEEARAALRVTVKRLRLRVA